MEKKSLVLTNELQLLSVTPPVPHRTDIDAALQTTVVPAAHISHTRESEECF